VIEPFFEYDHISSQNVSLSGYTVFESILIGQVSVQKLRRDIYMPGATFRLGLKDFEINAKVPYFFRQDALIFPQTGGGTNQLYEKDLNNNHLGDIESYVYYHMIKEGLTAPDTVLRVGVSIPTGLDPYDCKTQYISQLGAVIPVEFPTGTGHWGTSAGVTLAKTVDPGVFFTNLSYYYNFKRDVGEVNGTNYGEIKLGNSFEFNFGLVFALQEKLSMSFSYDQRITSHTTQDNNLIPDTALNAISFNIGATYVVSPKLTLDCLVGLGMSQDAPDISVMIRVPITFQFK
jgi:hypothetical protein